MSTHDIVADIRNKLGPFWALVDLLSLPSDDKNKISNELYQQMLTDTVARCNDNRELITAKLSELAQ